LRSSIAAKQRLRLACGGHLRLGSGGTILPVQVGSTLFPLSLDLLTIIGHSMCQAAMMDNGASREVVRRYVVEPDSRILLLESVGVLAQAHSHTDADGGAGTAVSGLASCAASTLPEAKRARN
jgi:hypothetical protein